MGTIVYYDETEMRYFLSFLGSRWNKSEVKRIGMRSDDLSLVVAG